MVSLWFLGETRPNYKPEISAGPTAGITDAAGITGLCLTLLLA